MLKKYAPHEMILDDKQNDELVAVVTEIENSGSKQSSQRQRNTVYSQKWNLHGTLT